MSTNHILLCGLLAFLSSCAPRTARFDERAFDRAVSLKVESNSLFEQATEPFVIHEKEVRALDLELRKAAEYARGRPDNEYTAKQWEILLDQERDLLGGALKRWKLESQLSAAFVKAKSKQIAAAFDEIIGLESRKIRAPKGGE